MNHWITRILTVLVLIALAGVRPTLAACLSAYHSETATNALNLVLGYTGLPRANFVIMASRSVNNARATMCDGDRYIYVNEPFMDAIGTQNNWNWKNLSILAHEIAHHVIGHSTVNERYPHKAELEADRYSGHLLYRMGASLKQATAMTETLPTEASTSHPGRADRVAAVRVGWKESDAALVIPGTGIPQPVNQDILISGNFPDLPRYLRGSRIEAIAHGPSGTDGDSKWHVIIRRSIEKGWQAYNVGDSEVPKEVIRKRWDEGYRINRLSYGNHGWVLLMEGERYAAKRQRWLTRHDFPEIEIKGGWDEGLRISSLSYGGGVWALVMTEDRREQIWRFRDKFSEIDEILRKRWGQGFHVTSLNWSAEHKWVLVMTKDSSNSQPSEAVFWRSYFPEELILDYLFMGYRVAHIVHDGADWIVVMTTRDSGL